MKRDGDPCVEIRIGESPHPLWMRRSALDRGEGPVMPEPNHDENHDENGFFANSYAHLFSDGFIRRYQVVIGKRADIREVIEVTS